MKHPIVWLHHANQQLGLVPTLGGAVAAWRCARPDGSMVDLLRPWDGVSEDMYQLASFAMVPWSNRIGEGGFTHDGVFHPIAPNRAGEPYPIHGDGWLQPWRLHRPAADTVVMELASRGFGGNPYDYVATQTFRLLPGGLDQRVEVRHAGTLPLPYGLGLHPWFVRTPRMQVQAQVTGVWRSGADAMPTVWTSDFPAHWDLCAGIHGDGPFIDNGFTGWDGQASITWPEHALRLNASAVEHGPDGASPGQHCLVYRPPQGPALCWEPITHPINAFHLPHRPGLRVLQSGQALSLAVAWRTASHA
ncbi:MAG: aldose 1-epimerase [Burkholderiaceae bacterium]